jgi:DNA-binding NarL/FixJ family response regulator
MSEHALARSSISGDDTGHRFTRREKDILRLIADGSTNTEIAATLRISSHTVAQHVTTMLRRTNSRNRVQLALLAAREGVLSPGSASAAAT